MGSLSIWHWLIVLLIVALVFGTKKLGSIGHDLGTAVRGFKKAMNEGEDEQAAQKRLPPNPPGGGSDRDAEFNDNSSGSAGSRPGDRRS